MWIFRCIVSNFSICRNIEVSIYRTERVLPSIPCGHSHTFSAGPDRMLRCTGIKYRNGIDYFYVYRYRIELDSDIDITICDMLLSPCCVPVVVTELK